MMEESEETPARVSITQPGTRQNTVDDEDADTETPGDSRESGVVATPGKDKESGVPPLSDSEDDSTKVLMPQQETGRSVVICLVFNFNIYKSFLRGCSLSPIFTLYVFFVSLSNSFVYLLTLKYCCDYLV